jgi:hypothetical protein
MSALKVPSFHKDLFAKQFFFQTYERFLFSLNGVNIRLESRKETKKHLILGFFLMPNPYSDSAFFPDIIDLHPHVLALYNKFLLTQRIIHTVHCAIDNFLLYGSTQQSHIVK